MSSAQPEIRKTILRSDSGAQELIGYTVEIDPEERVARAWLDVGEAHANRIGVLHGGLISTLLDAACGFTASMQLAAVEEMTPLVTVSLTTNYVSAAKVGSRVTAVGQPSGGGRKIAYVNGAMHDEQGRLIATATGVFKKVSAGRSA